jgi:signal transduction histidine kinase
VADDKDRTMKRSEAQPWGGLTIALSVGAGVLLGGVWLAVTIYFLSQLRNADAIRSLADRIHIDLLETRRREKDFLLRSLSDPAFQQRGVSPYLTLYHQALARLGTDLQELGPILPSGEPLDRDRLLALKDEYASAFSALVDRYRRLGTRDAGLEGDLIASLAAFENAIPGDPDPTVTPALLRLEIDERNFLLRPDEAAAAGIERGIDHLLERVRRARPDLAIPFSALVVRHRRDLKAVRAVLQEIGPNEDSGLQGRYRDAAHAIEPIVNRIVLSSEEYYAESSRRLLLSLVGSAVVLGVLCAATFSLTRATRVRAQHLGRATEELHRSNAELQQFAYVASHDLQEPLRAVAGCVQLLQQRLQGKLDERGDDLVRHAVEGCVRMQTLIEDLLTLSRAGQTQPAVRTDVEAVLRAALDNLAVTIRESGAHVTHDALPTIRADPGQLIQVFQNLLSNAIKFRSRQAPVIHVGAVRHLDGWRFSIQDNGIGIERQYFERIFRVFQRLHTREEYPGSGIGLSVCEKIVLRHGGRIWLESERGRGSTFYFSIPDGGAAV